ncbi:hypothetical protein WJX72_003388 [[Myrmecia] bisecta]|uniref:Uncharacterized protein n=1 Tax=[Myrmecia] bisecta TaxID=41462 RepID=A0AAW1PCS2_9CHLO
MLELQHITGNQNAKDAPFAHQLSARSEPGHRSIPGSISEPQLVQGTAAEGSSTDHPEFACINEAALALRRQQYLELEVEQHVYLDFTGGCLTSQQQVTEHMALLQCATAGNPHSACPAS